MSFQNAALFIGKLAISVGLLTWLFQGMDIKSLVGYLNGVTISTLVMVGMVSASTSIALGYRWNTILGYANAALPLMAATKNVIIGFFFNQFLPSTVGGDFVRIWLAKRRGLDIYLAANSIISDRIFGFLGLVLLCLLGLPFLVSIISNQTMILGESLLIIVALGAVGMLIGLQFIPAHLKKLRILKWAVAISDASAGVILRSGKGLRIIGLSLALHGLDVAMIFLMAVACGIEINVGLCLVLIPPALLVSAVPISIAGWGVREGAVVFALGTAGVVPGDAMTLSLFFGLAQALAGLIGGLVWVLSPTERVEFELAEQQFNPTND